MQPVIGNFTGNRLTDNHITSLVYNAMWVSVLIFGLETYHTKSLQKILGLHWWHKVRHAKVCKRAKVPCMEHLAM